MKKYFIITYGCQMNRNDSERWAFLFEREGLKEARILEEADIVLINMCSVREEPVKKVYQKIDYLLHLKRKKPDLKIYLTGCILEKDEKVFERKVDKILPIIDFSLPAKRKDKKTAYVSIMTGCNNFCSYCVVPYTRGREISKPFGLIKKEVEDLAQKGYKEIILLGQNVSNWQGEFQKKKMNFGQLLRELDKIPGNFEISFLTNHPKDVDDDLIKAMAEGKKIKKYLHLAVQSGDNEILKRMNRKYTVEEYKGLIKKIREKIPDIVLTTDIIVGFPGESEEQFENTVKLVKEIKFDNIYVSRYSPRPQTVAFKMKDNVPDKEKRRRREVLEKFLQEIKKSKER